MGVTGIRPTGHFPGSLAPRPRPAALTPNGQTMGEFLDACEKGRISDIHWFLKYYPNYWGCHRDGKQGLMYAAENGRLYAVQELLKAERAEADRSDNRGMTALLYAAAEGHAEVIRKLLEKKARASTTAVNLMNGLHFAARGGHIAVLEVLLPLFPKGLDSLDKRGASPLWCAVEAGNESAVRLLLDKGAKLGVTIDGQNMTDIAKKRGHFEIADMLTDEPARRAAEISASVDGGVSGGMKLKGPVKLLKQKREPPPPPPVSPAVRNALGLADLQKRNSHNFWR